MKLCSCEMRSEASEFVFGLKIPQLPTKHLAFSSPSKSKAGTKPSASPLFKNTNSSQSTEPNLGVSSVTKTATNISKISIANVLEQNRLKTNRKQAEAVSTQLHQNFIPSSPLIKPVPRNPEKTERKYSEGCDQMTHKINADQHKFPAIKITKVPDSQNPVQQDGTQEDPATLKTKKISLKPVSSNRLIDAEGGIRSGDTTVTLLKPTDPEDKCTKSNSGNSAKRSIRDTVLRKSSSELTRQVGQKGKNQNKEKAESKKDYSIFQHKYPGTGETIELKRIESRYVLRLMQD